MKKNKIIVIIFAILILTGLSIFVIRSLMDEITNHCLYTCGSYDEDSLSSKKWVGFLKLECICIFNDAQLKYECDRIGCTLVT